jgi:hypothetical protein
MLLERWICIMIAIPIQITSRIPTCVINKAWTEEALNCSVVRGRLTKEKDGRKKPKILPLYY